jgi:hypothetical protein
MYFGMINVKLLCGWVMTDDNNNADYGHAAARSARRVNDDVPGH